MALLKSVSSVDYGRGVVVGWVGIVHGPCTDVVVATVEGVPHRLWITQCNRWSLCDCSFALGPTMRS